MTIFYKININCFKNPRSSIHLNRNKILTYITLIIKKIRPSEKLETNFIYYKLTSILKYVEH